MIRGILGKILRTEKCIYPSAISILVDGNKHMHQGNLQRRIILSGGEGENILAVMAINILLFLLKSETPNRSKYSFVATKDREPYFK